LATGSPFPAPTKSPGSPTSSEQLKPERPGICPGYLTVLLAHSTVTGGPSLIEQLGDPLANLPLADTWRMVPQIISLIHDQCAFARMTPAA
jgi:hypothetical protein